MQPVSADAPKPAAVADGAGDACPEPLAWQQVLTRYRQESRGWELERPGYTLRGRTFGTGRPLYFLCGIGGSQELFALSVWLLREQFCCVLFDYPGTTTAAENVPRASVGNLAADLLAVADEHGDATFDLYATSFGTLVGLTAMLERPQRIERAILQGGFAHRRLSPFERLAIQVARRTPGAMRNLPGYKTIRWHNHRRWFPPFDETRWQFLVEDTGAIPIRSVANRAAMLHNLDLRPSLGEIEQRVLLLRSEGEGLVAESCHRELESGLPTARTEFLHTSGHLPYLTHPHRLVKLVREFLLPETDQPEATVSSRIE